ncbi:MAG: hypothetical protein WAK48_07890, partial [Candidatus Acidiferrum sp.]
PALGFWIETSAPSQGDDLVFASPQSKGNLRTYEASGAYNEDDHSDLQGKHSGKTEKLRGPTTGL